jgi:hypothetical protein
MFNLFPLLFTFRNSDVTVNWKIAETLDQAAGLRPLHLDPINLGSPTNAQNDAGS